MKKYLYLSLLVSFSAFSQVAPVTQGSVIQAAKINEVISTVNATEEELSTLSGKVNTIDTNLSAVTGKVNTLNVQEAWITATLTNGWLAYEPSQASHPTLQYFKDKMGMVHLRGLIKGSNTMALATLPVGYRPSKHSIFIAWTGSGPTRVDVSSSGTINWSEGASPSTFVSLHGISFRAEN